MCNTYHYNLLLLLLFFVIAPLHAMEVNPIDVILTQFFNAIKTCDLQTIRTLLKDNPRIVRPVQTLLKNDPNIIRTINSIKTSGIPVKNTYPTQFLTDIRQGHNTCKNQIAHILFCFGAAMDSNDDQPYEEDPASVLKIWEDEETSHQTNNKNLIEITEAHICTRLYKAIKNDNADEIRRLVKKYKLNINNPLPHYNIMLDYDILSTVVDAKNDIRTTQTPLEYAIKHTQNKITDLLIELGAYLNPQIDDTESNDYIRVAFADETEKWICLDENSEKTTESYLANTDYTEAFSETIDPITWTYINEISEEIEDIHSMDWTNADESSGTKENSLENTEIEPIPNTNNTEPDPMNNPPHVITSNTFPWKWISGGFAVIVITIATKKLYNWWQTNAESQETEDISEPQ